MKTVDMNVRPIFHYTEQRVRAHVFLCMLAYYVQWHMRARLKPMLFDDEHLDEASASRASPVLKAVRSEQAKAKDASKLAEDGTPLHSFKTLLKYLGALTYNVSVWAGHLDAADAGGEHGVHQGMRWTPWKTASERDASGTVRSSRREC